MKPGDRLPPEKTLPDGDRTEGGAPVFVHSAPTLGSEEVPPWLTGAPPFVVPGYEDWRFLGSGTFGQVWRARHANTTIPVAIKFFSGCAAEVEREVCRLALLAHTPGIIRLEGVYTGSAVPFVVMEYADHGSIAARLEAGGLPLVEALRLFRQIAEALAYVHSKGILHCDLKPANVLLDSRDNVRLADFGQAQLASDLSPSLGTFFFMAPEQAQLEPQIPDTRWDVYGLGAILYQMLTGKLPRHDEELSRTLSKTANVSERLRLYRDRVAQRPRPAEHRKVPGVDRDLADVVDRCLELDPAKRFPDANSVLEALARREHRRKQRPISAFGVVGPLLLMSVMLLLSWRQGSLALADASEELAQQRVASNKDTARLVAHALQRNLKVRIDRVGNQANVRELRIAVAAGDAEKMGAFLDKRFMLGGNGRPSGLFRSAWVTDPQGKILAVRIMGYDERDLPNRSYAPDIEKEIHNVHKQFTWRDWFSGQGDREGETLPMVGELYVSDPYLSVVENTGTVIAISMPIRRTADAKSEVIGLLTASVRMGTLALWLKEAGRLSDGGTVLLLNRARGGRRSLLLENGQVVQPKGKVAETYEFPDLEAGLQDPAGQGELLEHVSPIDDKEYLAGYARTTEELGPRGAKLDWVVLVRHEKAAALRSLGQLRDDVWRGRVLTYAATAVLMASLWAWLFWLMRRRDSLAG